MQQAMRLLWKEQSSDVFLYAPIARILYSMDEGTEKKKRLGNCLI